MDMGRTADKNLKKHITMTKEQKIMVEATYRKTLEQCENALYDIARTFFLAGAEAMFQHLGRATSTQPMNDFEQQTQAHNAEKFQPVVITKATKMQTCPTCGRTLPLGRFRDKQNAVHEECGDCRRDRACDAKSKAKLKHAV